MTEKFQKVINRFFDDIRKHKNANRYQTNTYYIAFLFLRPETPPIVGEWVGPHEKGYFRLTGKPPFPESPLAAKNAIF